MTATRVSFTAATTGLVPIHAEAADLTTSRLPSRGAAERVASTIAVKLSVKVVVDVDVGTRYERMYGVSKYGASDVYTPVEEAWEQSQY